jgi:hypothetical protein
MPKPRPKIRKVISANSIVLKDDKGEPRIIMSAGHGKWGATIVLHAKDGKSIQISEQPEGAISIAILGRNCRSQVVIGVLGDERGDIQISDSKSGKLGTILGEEPGTSTHRLLLFKNGQHFWNTPTGRPTKKVGGSRKPRDKRPESGR